MSTTVFEMQDRTLIVRPQEQLDTATSPVLEAEVRRRLDGVQEIIMDLEKVDYISSGGIRVLLTVSRWMDDVDGVMKVIHANQYVMDVFDMVGFTDMVTVED